MGGKGAMEMVGRQGVGRGGGSGRTREAEGYDRRVGRRLNGANGTGESDFNSVPERLGPRTATTALRRRAPRRATTAPRRDLGLGRPRPRSGGGRRGERQRHPGETWASDGHDRAPAAGEEHRQPGRTRRRNTAATATHSRAPSALARQGTGAGPGRPSKLQPQAALVRRRSPRPEPTAGCDRRPRGARHWRRGRPGSWGRTAAEHRSHGGAQPRTFGPRAARGAPARADRPSSSPKQRWCAAGARGRARWQTAEPAALEAGATGPRRAAPRVAGAGRPRHRRRSQPGGWESRGRARGPGRGTQVWSRATTTRPG